MQQPDYSISTPENVDLHLEVAGVGNRLLAQSVDCLIQMAVGFFIIILAIALAVFIYNSPLDTKSKNLGYGVLAMVAILFIFFMQNAYFIIWEGAWKGQTPGKKLAEIRVIEQNGQPIGWSGSLIRNLMRVVDSVFLLGMVVMLFDKNERRLGDLCAGTIVIRERQAVMTDSAIKLSFNQTADGSLDIGRVSPSEYDLLVDYLKRRTNLTKTARPKVARQMYDHFARKLMLEEGELPAPAGPNDVRASLVNFSSYESFLEKVYLSYRARAAE